MTSRGLLTFRTVKIWSLGIKTLFGCTSKQHLRTNTDMKVLLFIEWGTHFWNLINYLIYTLYSLNNLNEPSINKFSTNHFSISLTQSDSSVSKLAHNWVPCITRIRLIHWYCSPRSQVIRIVKYFLELCEIQTQRPRTRNNLPLTLILINY